MCYNWQDMGDGELWPSSVISHFVVRLTNYHIS